MTMTKEKILKDAHKQRVEEVLAYQINIDNYRLAIFHIEESGDPDLQGFKGQLETLLKTEVIEQKKSNVMLAVIEKQIGGA